MKTAAIPDVLHICPACETCLATGAVLCETCRADFRTYRDAVRDGEVAYSTTLEDVLMALDAVAETYAESMPEPEPAAAPILSTRPVISTPDRACSPAWDALIALLCAAGLLAWVVFEKWSNK